MIFDLDGTLTESEPGIIGSVRYALEKMGREPLSPEALRRFIGPPLMESFMDIAGMTEEDAARAVEIYRERFSVLGWKENSVYPGIASLLRSLKAAGAYVALATGKPGVFAMKILQHFGLAPFVDRVAAVTLDDHHADKALLVRRALRKYYERACMVGDRAGDIEGALANGIDGIGALYGYGTREELEGAGAAYIAETPAALAAYLLGDTPPVRGAFIAFEGSDGCGKTTQMKRTAQWLSSMGFEVVSTREPGGCPIAERIRDILLDVGSSGMTPECEALLYAAARAQHVREVILPALAAGKIVLSDRYLDSSLAYQGAGRELGVDQVARMNEPATGGLKPDLTLFYDLNPDKAIKRRLAASVPDRMELEKAAFRQRVYDAFVSLSTAGDMTRVSIDADRQPDPIEEDTRRAVARVLGIGQEDIV